MPDQQQYQIIFPDAEARRIRARIQSDFSSAISDHNTRMGRWRQYFRRWVAAVDPPTKGALTQSNFPVPVIKWNVAQKWAQNTDSIFGDDAEIVAVPTGPSDYRNDRKIGLYMTWRVFNQMQLTNRFAQFELYKIIYGRVIAYAPWKKDSFTFDTSNGTEEHVYYKGSDFVVLEPEDFIVPAEQAETLHDFSWVIRRYRATPNELLIGEDDGRYQSIRKNFSRILQAADKRSQRSVNTDDIKREKDDAEGVSMESGLSAGSSLEIHEWYGRWRMLKKGKKDADEWSTTDRQLYQSDIVVRYCPDLDLIIGASDLRKLYPAKPKPRPLVEASYQKDGSYWCQGLAAQLIDIEDEVRANHNLGADAQGYSVAPVIFYRPASGYDPSKNVYKPGAMIATDNPGNDVKVITITFDAESVAQREQALLAYAERLTGNSDFSMGRQSDRPNAPKTARGTMAILEQGNLRMTLDTTILREDFSRILQHFWLLEWMFADEETFFRVTEDDADGAFPVQDGGSLLKQSDRNGQYDFRLQLATSKWSREADKERTLARYQLDLQNPLIAQNPNALWKVTRDAHEALGDPNFADIVPEPPMPDAPINPKQEWSMIQQGETIQVNPMDNDQLHMIRHMKDLQTAIRNGYTDQDALQALQVHYIDHLHQLQEKKLVQAIAERMVQRASELGNGNPMAGAQAAALPPALQRAVAKPQPPGVQQEQSEQEQPAA